MGVSVREVKLKEGGVSFSLDIYYKGQRQQVKTEIRSERPDGREYLKAKRQAEIRANELDKQLQIDPSAVFMGKARRASCFIEYFKEVAFDEKKGYSIYQCTLKHLRDFNGSSPLFMQTVSLVWAERFRAYLDALPIKETTKLNYLRALKAILNKAVSENLIPDFSRKLKPFKKNDTLPKFLSVEQVKTLEAAQCGNPAVKAGFLFSCFTGLRVSDVERLQFSDIQQDGERVTIRYKMQKTQRWQFLPLGAQALKYLEAGKKLHAELPKDEKGQDALVFALPTRSTSMKVLARWGKSAELPFPLGWHCGRHSFAVLSLANGVELFAVSKLLGHSSINMTQIYAKVLDQQKVAAMDKLPSW